MAQAYSTLNPELYFNVDDQGRVSTLVPLTDATYSFRLILRQYQSATNVYTEVDQITVFIYVGFFIPENAIEGTPISHVAPQNAAIPADRLVYSITTNNVERSVGIDQDGNLFVNGPLDFESYHGVVNGTLPSYPPHYTAFGYFVLEILVTVLPDPDNPNDAWGSYTETIRKSILIQDAAGDDVVTAGDSWGHAYENGDFQLFFGPQISSGRFATFSLDFDYDGDFDWQSSPATASTISSAQRAAYYSHAGGNYGYFLTNVARESIYPTGPSTIVYGVHQARYRAVTYSGLIVQGDIPIEIEDMPPVVRMANFGRIQQSEEYDTVTADLFSLRYQSEYEYLDGSSNNQETRVTDYVIDWGDGTPAQTLQGSHVYPSHTYMSVGKYFIQIYAHEANQTGYLGYEFELGDWFAPQLDPVSYVTIDQSGAALLEVNASVSSRSIGPLSYSWDLDGDGMFDDILPSGNSNAAILLPNPTWTVEPITPGTDPVYRARVLIADGANRHTVGYFDFTGAPVSQFTTSGLTEEKPRPQYIGTQPPTDGFDIDAAMDIVHQLRPDVYKWFNDHNGEIELAWAKNFITGLFTLDVWHYYKQVGTVQAVQRPWIRLHAGMTELDAAKQIIDLVDNGYWFAGDFRADKILAGATEWDHVDAFGQWQEWYGQEMARKGLLAYETVSSWYTFQLTGAEIVMTAKDILTTGPKWYHALDLIQVLPFLSKLEIPIVIKDKDGVVLGKVQKTADGIRYTADNIDDFIVVNHFYTDFKILSVDDYPSSYSKALLSQTTGSGACANTCAEMLLLDMKIDWRKWKIAPARPDGYKIPELVKWINDSTADLATPRMVYFDMQNQGSHLEPLLKMSEEHGKSFVVGLRTNIWDATKERYVYHAVVVDGTLIENGKRFVIVRDPAYGAVLSIGYAEFIDRFHLGEVGYWIQ